MNTAIKTNVYPLKRVDNEIDMSNPAETCTAPASHLIERLEAEKQLAEWHKVFGHLSKDADTAGNMINEGIAERDKEIAGCSKFNFELQQANVALRAEVERLKVTNPAIWQDGWEHGHKQAAQEIIEDVIGEWNCDCGYGGLVIADAIKAKFGLEYKEAQGE